jgi:hypothetical protein
LKDKHPIEYFALNHPSVAQPSVNVLAPVVNYNNITINVGNDPNLMKEYKKVVHEKETLIRKLKDIVQSDDHMDIQTKTLIYDLITGTSERKQIRNNRDEVKSNKRKISRILEVTNNKPQSKRVKTNEIGDGGEGKTCSICHNWKPISQYQRNRKYANDEDYVYTHPSKCNYCQNTKNNSPSKEIEPCNENSV